MRLIVPLLLALTALPASAQTARDADGFTTVTLVESAQRDVPRDRLKITLRVEEIGPDPAAVQAAVNRRVAAAVERARAVAGIRVETGGYWVGEEAARNAPTRWRGNQTLTLITGNPSALLPLAGELQASGLLAAGQAWELTPGAARQVEDELTAEALQRARQRAEFVAREMGLAVVRFAGIAVGGAGRDLPQPMPRMMAAPASASFSSAPPPMVAEAGEQTVVVNVQVEVLLRPR